jgi:two-component system heavy metal sensor histidine kinase CusS
MSSTSAERRWSLAARLTAWYAGSAFVLVLAAVAFLYWALVSTLEREDDQYLADKARVLVALLRDDPDDVRELRQEVERESGPRPAGQVLLRVVDASGRSVAETPGMSERLAAELIPQPNDERAVPLRAPSGQQFRALALRAPGGRVVQVAMDRSGEEDLLFSYRCYAGVALAAGLLVSAAAGYALARRGLRPLREITQTAREIRSSTLDQRLDRTALPAELADLAGTFNEMLDRLEESFRRLERFSADIAHELRTPVNNLRGEVEVALGQPRSPEQYREVLESSLEEFGRLTSLIDTLLFLARAESPQAQISRQLLDVGRELETVRDFYEAAANEAGIDLKVKGGGGIIAELDRTLFHRAVSNLVANALSHTPRGGEVTLGAARDGDLVRVEVCDTGRGIAAEHLPHVFDRFYRADLARTSVGGSVGLGLALVKSIATLHGGSCAIESEPGRGTTVRLLFKGEPRS